MKRVIYRIYQKDGTLVREYENFESTVYSASINSGYSDIDINIPESFDFFWGNIAFNGYVERWVYDSDAPTGVMTYRGYISERNSEVSNDEISSIKALGLWSKFSKVPITTASNLQISYSNQDTGAIMRDIITKYRADNTVTDIIAPNTGDIPNTGVTVTYAFNSQTYAQAINLVKDMTGANWYYFLDNDDALKFRQITTASATHLFTIGRDIASAKYTEDIDQLTNGVFLWNGVPTGTSRIFSLYTASDSITTYGKQFTMIKDNRVLNITASTAVANRRLNAFKNPLVRLDLTILDKEYGGEGGSQINIESIKPGDTFKIVNVDSTAPFADTVYYITKITDKDGMTLDISSIDAAQYVAQQIAKLTERLNNADFGVTYSQPFTT